MRDFAIYATALTYVDSVAAAEDGEGGRVFVVLWDPDGEGICLTNVYVPHAGDCLIDNMKPPKGTTWEAARETVEQIIANAEKDSGLTFSRQEVLLHGLEAFEGTGLAN